MRPIDVIRWLFVVPSAIVAWYAAFLVGGTLLVVLVVPCRDSDQPQPRFCEAPWFPLELMERGVFFFGVGLSAALTVAVSALVAPSHRTAVAYTVLTVGTVVAGVLGYRIGAVAEAAFAIVCGGMTVIVVSRFERRSRDLKTASGVA